MLVLLPFHCVTGGAVLALLLAGYLGQMYMPPPKPRIIGIDLGNIQPSTYTLNDNSLCAIWKIIPVQSFGRSLEDDSIVLGQHF